MILLVERGAGCKNFLQLIFYGTKNVDPLYCCRYISLESIVLIYIENAIIN